MIRLLIFMLFFISNSVFSQESEDKTSFELYPNPASEYINLKFSTNLSLDNHKISIHSLIGNEINFNKENLSDSEIRIYLEEFNNGYYFLIIDNLLLDKRKIIKFSKN